jgi:site-specific DNA-methyltransferase (adenine-specific)
MAEKGLKFDAIITDPPYGTTACKWDSVIPFDKMWECLKNLRKENAPVILFGSEPFSSLLRCSNLKEFKYDWIWNKKLAGNGLLAKKQPLKIHEIVSVFYKHNYFPVKEKGKLRSKMFNGKQQSELHSEVTECQSYVNDEYYPKSIIEFSIAGMRSNRLHPTQKSLELLKYLIKTYTSEDSMILDFTCGSGTTLVASKKLNRKCYGIELEEKYCEITKNRLMELDDTQ